MARVLFSTPTQPYPTHFCNDTLTDLTGQRLTKGQDIFTLYGHMHCHGCHLIAQNISASSVFLEYPFKDDFEEEVKKGYDFVGISFFATCMENVLDMCRLVRRISPKSKIILGGYGALAFNASFPEDFRKDLADYVCVGEGISFMRKLLGDPVDAPIRHGYLPKCGSNLPWIDPDPKGNIGFIVAGLGCPSGCDFCATTEMHGNARIQITGPQVVFEELKRYYRSYPEMQHVLIYDEDTLKYTEEVRELGKLIQEDSEFGLRKLSWYGTSSIESLNQYDWDELALTGLCGTFFGIESKFAPEEGYQKRIGDARDTVYNLQKRGIACSGGFMCGFDFHDRVNIQEDLNYFISLELVSHQITRLSPYPGTPLWMRVKEEDRLEEIPWVEQNFYGGGLRHNNFEAHEIEHIILEGYQRYYNTYGPTLMRQLKVELNGYEYCRESKNHLLREEKTERHREVAFQLYPTIRACEYFAPNGLVRRKIRQLQERYVKIFGSPTRAQIIQSYYILYKAAQAKLMEAFKPREPKQEPFKKFIYDKNGGKEGMSYKVLYPRRERSYLFQEKTKEIKLDLFSNLINLIEGFGKPKESLSSELFRSVKMF